MNKTSKLHTDHAGGTIAGAIVGGYAANKYVKNKSMKYLNDMHVLGISQAEKVKLLDNFWKTMPKLQKAKWVVPGVLAGAAAGYGLGQGLDALFLKKGEAQMDKAEIVYGKLMEKDAQWLKGLMEFGKGLGVMEGAKGLFSAGKTMAKGYGKNIAKDWTALKGAQKGISAFSKAKNLNMLQQASMAALKKERNKALVGLAGRVGFPAMVGYSALNS